jgi:hypothetical protein
VFNLDDGKEIKEVKKRKVNKINLGNLQISEEVTFKDDEIRESIILFNGEEILTEIVYDEGRDKYRAAITRNARKVSLSFFNSKKIAYKSVLISVAAVLGVKIKDTNINVLEGF